jgi:CheY-like chemotaxis protein
MASIALAPSRKTLASTGPLVLIVEDDPAVRDSLESVLEAYSYRTEAVRDGREGMSAIATGRQT